MEKYRPRHRASARARRRLVVVAAVVGISAIVAGSVVVADGLGRHGTPTAAHPPSGEAPAAIEVGAGALATPTATARTESVIGGGKAGWIVAENSKPGTTAWELDASATGAPIDGYADHTSAQVGQTVALYVSTPAPSYHVAAFRMGYYAGTGSRLVWTSPELAGTKQELCPVTNRTNMVECSWTPSTSVSITASWPPGQYLFKLIADSGQQNYIPLTVWDPSSHATFVIQSSVLTWQAWNDYGGYSNFGGVAANGPSPSFADRARVLSFDRPYAKGFGSSDFLGLEFPLISLVEQHGLDVTYWTDIDFSENPELVSNHKALLSLGHNEFITIDERQGEVDGRSAGVNLAFFGATPDLRPARLQASPLGPDREEVAYRDPREDPISRTDPKLATANTWDQAPLGKPASQIVGDTYGGYGINASMVVVKPDAWPFAGTGLMVGSQLRHVVLGDYDNYLPGQDSPANVEILAHSPVHTSYGHSGMADMTYYDDPQTGAGIFATGSIGWIPSLAPCAPTVAVADCPADAVAAITLNVLRLFGAGPAGVQQPSVVNWRSFFGGSQPTAPRRRR